MPRVKHLTATVNYADNQLQIYVNSQLAMDTGYKDNDPALDQQQSLDSFLKSSGPNEILVVVGLRPGGELDGDDVATGSMKPLRYVAF